MLTYIDDKNITGNQVSLTKVPISWHQVHSPFPLWTKNRIAEFVTVHPEDIFVGNGIGTVLGALRRGNIWHCYCLHMKRP